MLTALAVAAYAIDVSIWFVHHRHLQTEADAAALAAAADFQYPCTPFGTMDQAISNRVHQYDGTTAPTPASPSSLGYNPQVPVTPAAGALNPSRSAYSNTQHNLFSVVNRTNYFNQSQPNDTGLSGTPDGDGSPCSDAKIDVKLSETNLPSSLIPFGPGYVNAHAQVSIKQQASASGSEPLALPSPAPSTVTATLIDEGNNNQAIPGAGPLTLTQSNGTTWTSNSVPVTFDSSVKGPVGLRVAAGGGSTCGTQLQCYTDPSGSLHGIGIAYTRVYDSVSSVTAPASPALNDATVSAASTNGCPLDPSGAYSNFISDSSSCNVQLTANAQFASGITCNGTTPQATMKLTVTDASNNNTSTSMTCPSGGSASGAWASQTVAIPANSGPLTLKLDWTQTSGSVGTDNKGNPIACTTSKPCSGTFNVVQRVFSGASDAAGANSSQAGPIIGAALTYAGTQNEAMSIARSSTPQNVQITVTMLNLGFTDATTVATGNPVTLHTGGSQGTFAIECNGNNGASQFTTYVFSGCPQQFGTTDQPNPPICSAPSNPPVCVTQDPGTGKVIEPGIDQRVNGSQNAPTCLGPNRWTSPNSVYDILHQTPNDPRLIQLMIVDSAAWVGVSGASTQTPVRQLGTFYITGWSGPPATTTNQGGDPCFNSCPTTSPQPCVPPGGGLPYVNDDNPGSQSNVLLGHFVHKVDPPSSGNPGPQLCTQTTFGNCIAVLTE